MADLLKPGPKGDAQKPPEAKERSYHSIDEFLTLSFEELLREPVYLSGGGNAEEIGMGNEADPDTVPQDIAINEFLDLDFEQLFNVAVKVNIKKDGDSSDLDTQMLVTSVPRSGSSFGNLKQVRFDKDQDNENRVFSVEREQLITSNTMTTMNEPLLPILPPINNAPTAPPFYLGALEEQTSGIQFLTDNIFRVAAGPNILNQNLFNRLIPTGGDGTAVITILTRPDSNQVKTQVIGSSKITITTDAGNTFEFYTKDEGVNKAGDYTYTLLNKIFHGSNPNNIPSSDFPAPGTITQLDQSGPLGKQDGVPTVAEIIKIIGDSFNDATFPDLVNLIVKSATHYAMNPIDAIYAVLDSVIGNTYFEVFVYDVVDSDDGDRARGFIIIKILDDIPIAVNDVGAVNETKLFLNGSESVAVNLLSNDDKGADGAKVNSVLGIIDGGPSDLDGIVGIPNGSIKVLSTGGVGELTVNTITGASTYSLKNATAYSDGAGTGSDVITYTLIDGDGDISNFANLTITIDLNQAPVAVNDAYGIDEDSILKVTTVPTGLFKNDTDPDNSGGVLDTQTLNSNTLPSKGILTTNANGTFSYNTNGEFEYLAQGQTEQVTFNYTMKDAGGLVSNTAIVTLTITGVNDAPVANDQSINAVEDGPAITNVFFAADDVDSDNNQSNLIYTIVTPLAPNKGALSNISGGKFTYNPGSDFQYLAKGQTENVTFTYKATDVHGADSATKTVTITVTGVNDAPVANDQYINAVEDGPAITNVLFAADDVDSDNNQSNLIYTIVTGLAPNKGSLSNISGGKFTYNPDSDFQYLAKGQTENVTFTYKATDSHGADSATKTVTITVTGVNDAPVANDQFINALEDGPSVANVLFAADDVDSDNNQSNLIYTIVTGLAPNKGSLSNISGGNFTYNPDSDFQYLAKGQTEIVTFTYKATDAHLVDSGTKTVFITVTGVNDAPVAIDQSINATEDGPAITNVLFAADDVDSDNNQSNLIYTIVTPLAPNKGSLSNISGGKFTYNPDSDFQYLAKGQTENVTFTYKATDSHGADSATKTVTITVTGVNDAPVANDQFINALEDGPSVANVLFAADDVDSDNNQSNLIYTIVTGLAPNQGSLSNISGGNFTYNPDSDFQYLAKGQTEIVTFTYKATDAHLVDSGTKTVFITVTGVNDAPVAIDQSINATEDGPAITNVLFAADDVDSDDSQASLTYTIVTGLSAGEGSLSNISGGKFTYNPGSDFQYLAKGQTENVTFTYKATDVHGADSTTKTVTITVTGVNDAPILDLDSVAAGLDYSTTFTEGDPAVALYGTAVSVTDVDDTNIEFAEITLTNQQDGVSESIFISGVLPVGITVDGIPTSTYIKLTGSASLADYQAALQLVRYENTSENPNETPRSIEFVVNDGDVNSTVAVATVSVAAVNDAPILDLDTVAAGLDYSTTFTEGGPAVALYGTAVSVTDVDDTNIEFAEITLTNPPDGLAESISISGVLPVGITVDGSSTSTYIKLTGSVSLADYQAALQLVRYENTSENPNETDRVINFVVNDGNVNSTVAVATVSVVAVNDAPLLDLDSVAVGDSYSTSFTAGDSAIALFGTNVGITDVDDMNIDSAEITLTNQLDGAFESIVLSGLLPSGITVNGAPTSTSIKLIGSATLADYQTALQLIEYSNTSATPDLTTRLINFVVNDGVANSNIAVAEVVMFAMAMPIVLDLNGNGIELISVNDSNVLWDMHNSSGTMTRFGWVGSGDGLLVFDANGDGNVLDAREFIFTTYAPEAKSDLEALQIAFDTNFDSIFDSQDTHFNSFGVWQDRNSDGIVDSGEFNSLPDMGIVSISLVSDGQTGMIAGNIISGYSTYTTSDGGTHTLADVGLLTKDTQVQITPQDVLHSENISIDNMVNTAAVEPVPPATLVAEEFESSMDGQVFVIQPPALNQDLGSPNTELI